MITRLGPDDDRYVIEDDMTFRLRRAGAKVRKELIAAFAVRLQMDVTVYGDRDGPNEPTRILVLRYQWRDAEGSSRDAVVELEAPRTADFGRLIARSIPDAMAGLSVRSNRQLSAAIAALTPFTFFPVERFRQTGWRGDSTFSLPLDEADTIDDLELGHLRSPGARLLGLPGMVDIDRARSGASTWLTIARAASVATAGTVFGTMLAAPMARQEQHLGARGFTTLIVAPTGTGKTTFASRAYAVMGRFDRLPNTLESWASAAAAIEATCHTMRDLPVLVDDYRDLDGASRETFRTIAMAVGNGTSRGRREPGAQSKLHVGAAARPKCLLIGTAETAPEGDAGEAARVLVVSGHNFDVESLLAIDADSLADLPHLYRAFIEWLGRQDEGFWQALRDERAAFRVGLRAADRGRVAENLSSVASALVAFIEFLRQLEAEDALMDGWRALFDAYCANLPALARQQTARVSEETIDGLFLSELARGIRTGEIALPHVGQSAWRPKGPLIVGYYDGHLVYVRPAIAADWVSRQLLTARRRKLPITPKAVAQALGRRGGRTGEKTQRIFGGNREKFRIVERAHLDESWDGLFGTGSIE